MPHALIRLRHVSLVARSSAGAGRHPAPLSARAPAPLRELLAEYAASSPRAMVSADVAMKVRALAVVRSLYAAGHTPSAAMLKTEAVLRAQLLRVVRGEESAVRAVSPTRNGRALRR